MEGHRYLDIAKRLDYFRTKSIPVARCLSVPIRIIRSAEPLTRKNVYYTHSVPQHFDVLRGSHYKINRRRKKVLSVSIPTLILSFAFYAVIPISNISVASSANQVKDEALQYSESGIKNMKDGLELMKRKDFKTANQKFRTSSNDIQSAIEVLNRFGQYQTSYSYSSSIIADSYNLLQSAELINKSLLIGSSTLDELDFSLSELTNEADAGKDVSLKYLFSNQSKIQANLAIISKNLTEALSKSHSIKDKRLISERNKITSLLPSIINSIESFRILIDGSNDIFGLNEPRKILVLFLNNAELRPGGGFIGSYATSEIKNGKISKFNIDTNIIKKDHTFGALYKVQAPYPLSKVSNEWYMRDSNWSVNVNDSARLTSWFFENEGGSKIDLVVSIDSTFVAGLLSMTGPLKLSDGSSLNDQNFNDLLTNQIESAYWKNEDNKHENEPKSIIKDIYPAIESALIQQFKNNPIKAYELLKNNFDTKHINISYTGVIKNDFEMRINENNEFSNTDDFIMVNNANAGGLKSSLNVEQKVDVNLEVYRNKMVHKVYITRSHNGTRIWPDGDNHNYIRIVVPKGAKLINGVSSGAEEGVENNSVVSENEAGYTTFGLWQTTPVGKTTVSVFEYETLLPKILLKKDMKLLYYKQPGSTGDMLKVNIFSKEGVKVQDYTSFNKFSNTDEIIRYSLAR